MYFILTSCDEIDSCKEIDTYLNVIPLSQITTHIGDTYRFYVSTSILYFNNLIYIHQQKTSDLVKSNLVHCFYILSTFLTMRCFWLINIIANRLSNLLRGWIYLWNVHPWSSAHYKARTNAGLSKCLCLRHLIKMCSTRLNGLLPCFECEPRTALSARNRQMALRIEWRN